MLLSTPMDLRSSTGASKSFMYRLRNITNDLPAVLFDTTFAVGNSDHSSTATKMYASLFNSSGKGPAKSNCDFSLDSTTGSIWNGCVFPNAGFKFLHFFVPCRQF